MKKIYLYLFLQVILFGCVKMQAQHWEWIKHFGSNNGNDNCKILAIDSRQNFYAIIRTNDTMQIDNVSFYNGSYLAKFDSLGQLIWKKPSNGTKYMAIDSLDNIYLIGYFYHQIIIGNDTLTTSSYYINNTYIAKYDSAFNPIWAKAIGSTFPEDIKILNGNIYISAYFSAVICGIDTIYAYNSGYLAYDAIILKYSTDGNYLNNTHFYDYGYDGDCDECCQSFNNFYPLPIFIDKQLSIYTIAYFHGQSGISINGCYFFTSPSCGIWNTILCKFDSSFNCVYAHQGNIKGNLLLQNNQLYFLSNSGSILAYDGDTTMLLYPYNLVFGKINNSTGALEGFAYNKLDSSDYGSIPFNNLTVILNLSQNSLINNDTITNYFYDSINNPKDYFSYLLLRYDTNLNVVKNIRISDSDINGDGLISVVSSEKNYYIAQNFYTNIRINNSTYSTYGNGDFIIGKFIDDETEVPQLLYKSSLYTIYPNPTFGHVVINSNKPNQKASISIYDMYGRMVCFTNTKTFPVDINLTGNKPGLYFVKITTDEHTYTKKIIIE